MAGEKTPFEKAIASSLESEQKTQENNFATTDQCIRLRDLGIDNNFSKKLTPLTYPNPDGKTRHGMLGETISKFGREEILMLAGWTEEKEGKGYSTADLADGLIGLITSGQTTAEECNGRIPKSADGINTSGEWKVIKTKNNFIG